MTPKLWFRGRYVALLAILAMSALSPAITFANDLVFGPVTCQRGVGAPTVFNYTFGVTEPSRGYIFKVYNGGLEDTTYEQVSSSTITLNGVEILGPNNFSQNVGYLELPVVLQTQNTLNVEVRGRPGGAIILKLFPFVVMDSPADDQVFKTQPLAVSGHLNAAASSVSVNGLPATESGGSFTATNMPLAEGRNTLTASATRVGGFVGTDSVEVILDSTAPVITLAYPPEGLMTNQTLIPQYSVSDAQDPNPQVTVVPPPPYSAEGNYQMNVTAADWAGNSVTVTRGFIIDKTAPLIGGLTPIPGSATRDPREAISASFSDVLSGIDAASIRLLIDSTDVTSSAAISGQSVNYRPATPLADGSHHITLAVSDRAGNTATAYWDFVVDTTPPQITVNEPAEGASVATSIFDLSGSVNDPTAVVKVNGTGVVLTGNNFTVTGLALIPGQNTILIEAQDALGNGSSLPLHLTYVPPAPTASLTATPSQLLVGGNVVLQWSTSDAISVSITPDVGTVAASGSVTLSPAATTTYILSATGPGGTATAQTMVTVTQPTGNVSISASSSTIELGGSTTLSWSAIGATGIVINQGIGIVQATGSKVVQPTSTTEYVITAAGVQGASSASVVVTVLGNVQPQPGGSFGKQYEELVPSDATITAYSPKRFSLVNGEVKDKSGQPIAGVVVSVLKHPEYGTVYTDQGGAFTCPVEGGGYLEVAFKKAGYIGSQRQVDVKWNEIAVVESIVMLEEDPSATQVSFNGSSASVITHQSTPVADESGSRSCTMVFKGDNKAYAKVDGREIELTSVTVRATEFEVPQSMPSKLPANSGFTYCVNLGVDGADQVRFEKPVVVYVDNFLGFPVGMPVPAGYYDYQKGVWVPSSNGVVVRLLDVNGDGTVDALDATGDGLPDDLDHDGQTADEVEGIRDVGTYVAQNTYWRVEVTHFTPWDFNWPYAPPLDATAPTPEGNPVADQQVPTEEGEPSTCSNSYVENMSRVYHEDIPILGTGMTLHYASSRVPGYRTSIVVPISGATVPASLKKIIARVEVAGRTYEQTVAPATRQKVSFAWDGTDHLGKTVEDYTTAKTSIGYVYDYVYTSPANFQQAFAQPGQDVTAIRGRDEFISWKRSEIQVDGKQYNKRSYNGSIAQGWTISTNHFLDVNDTSKIYKGDGTISRSGSYAKILTTFAGTGTSGFAGDGGPAINAQFNNPHGIAIDSIGNVYVSDEYNNRVRKIDPSGMISTFAGTGQWGDSGEGGPAVSAKLNYPMGLAVDAFDNLYIADSYNCKVKKVDTKGIISTVAGNTAYSGWSACGYAGDGGPATSARFDHIQDVAVDRDGNVFLVDMGNYRVRKVSTSGIVTTLAGNGKYDPYVFTDNVRATDTNLAIPKGVDVDGSGNVYIADEVHRRIRKVDTRGIISTVAGNGGTSISGDGGKATNAGLGNVEGVRVDRQGNIYILNNYYNFTPEHRIRMVDAKGIIKTIAGKAPKAPSEDGGLAEDSSLYYPLRMAVDGKGNVYFTEYTNKVKKISYPMAIGNYYDLRDILVPSQGDEWYVFSQDGLHKSTVDQSTGVMISGFEYTGNGHLSTIQDRFGRVTQLLRDANDNLTGIVSPDGATTFLNIDANNLLRTVTYPDGSLYHFEYSAGGLLTDEFDPNQSHFVHEYSSEGRLAQIHGAEGELQVFAQSTDTSGAVFATASNAYGETTTFNRAADSGGTTTMTTSSPDGSTSTTKQSLDMRSVTSETSCGKKTVASYGYDKVFQNIFLTSSETTLPSTLKSTVTGSLAHEDVNQDGVIDRTIKTTSLNGKTWEVVKDLLANTVSSKSPENRLSTVTYDPLTLLPLQESVPGSLPTMYGYDGQGRLTSVSAGSRNATFGYTADGKLEYIATADGTTSYTYDLMGRVASENRPDGSKVEFQYDSNGNLSLLTSPNEVSFGFTYTANDQRSSFVQPLSGTYRYSYDLARRLKTITAPSGEAIVNTYVAGNLATTTTPEGVSSYGYLCGGRLGSASRNAEGISLGYDGSLVTSDTRSGTLAKVLSYTYNSDFSVASMTYAGGSITLGYDNDGLLATADGFTISRNAQNGQPERVIGNGLDNVRTFNDHRELDGSASSIAGALTYSWSTPLRDDAGRIHARQETIGGSTISWEYSYNPGGKLLSVKREGVLVESYTYDLNGNRLTENNNARGIVGRTFSYSEEDHVVSAGADSYQFDVDGFLQSKTAAGGTISYSYSSRGELQTAWLSNGDILTFIHDPFGRRIAKKVNGTTVEKYLWKDQSTLLAVYDRNDNLLQRYTYADARMPVSMTAGEATYFLLTDQVGTLRAVTDTTGAIVKRIDYDSFGNIIADSNPAFNVPFGFAGGLHDRDTGLVRFGARDYDPAIGRFTAKDPIDFAGGDTNLYAYTMNDPVNWIDPLGLDYTKDGLTYSDAGNVIGEFGLQPPAPFMDPIDWVAGFGGASVCGRIGSGAVKGAVSAGARTEAANLAEQLALKEAGAGAGERIMPGAIKDPRFPADIWAKMQHMHETPGGGNIVIHYWQRLADGFRTGFKFK